MSVALPTAGTFRRGVQQEPAEDPWAYARRCAGTLTHGQITIAVESGNVVQVDCTEKKRFQAKQS